MKKYGMIISIIIISSGLLILNLYKQSLNFKKDNIIQNGEKEVVSGINSLAIMLEGDDGNYTVSNSDTWPTEGYVFNPTLSTCENGGTLSWDNGKVTLKTHGSDKCYVYFDKYNPITITDVKINTSIDWDRANYNITITASGGKGKLSYGVSTNSGFDNISWQDSNIVYGVSMDCVDKPYIKVKDESNHYIEQQVDIRFGDTGGEWYIC